MACLGATHQFGQRFRAHCHAADHLAPPLHQPRHLIDAGGNHPNRCCSSRLLWILRHRPLLFGSLLALGVCSTAICFYRAATLLVVQWRDGALLVADLKFWAIAALAALAVFDLFSKLSRVWWSPFGPGTYYDPTIPSAAAATVAFACFDARTIPRGIWNFASDVLPLMLGGTEPDARLPFVAAPRCWLRAACSRSSRTLGRQASRRNDYLVYLLVAGGLSAFVYVVARCGAVNEGTIGYGLVTPFGFVGGWGLLFSLEPSRRVRHLLAAIVCAWGLWQFVEHARIFARAVLEGPSSPRLTLTSYLETASRYAWATTGTPR